MKILISTGGSGGHIFPALMTARVLRERGHTIVFAGSFGKNIIKVEQAGYECFEIPGRGFAWRKFLPFLKATVGAILKANAVISRVDPDVVIGFGGYGSFAIVTAGILRAKPCMTHEQNVVPGKANKVLGFFVKRIAVSFDKASNHFSKKKIVFVGCPARPIKISENREGLLKGFGLVEGRKTILALGGSLGSHAINQEFVKAVAQLKDKYPLQVIHLTGAQDLEECQREYKKLGVLACVFGFTDEIDKAYSIADLVVSRAGAMTVTEIAAYGLPAIMIPYPYAGGHQRENAKVLCERRGAILLEQEQMLAGVLKLHMDDLLSSNLSKSDILKWRAGIYQPQAAVLLANEVEHLK